MRETLVSCQQSDQIFESCHKGITPESEKISDLIEKTTNPFSLELCPNRGLNAQLLSDLRPKFCSVTWLGEEYSNVDRVPALILAQQLHYNGYNVLLHLAGRNLGKNNTFEVLSRARQIGIRNILALQGDPAYVVERDDAKCELPYASDLVSFIREKFRDFFCIAVAGYPEKHPNSPSIEEDFGRLKEKVEKGVDLIITQASFQYEAYRNFCVTCERFLITVPVIPGIFVITSAGSMMAMSKFCQIPVSDEILKIVAKNCHNNESVKEYGMHLATQLVRKILLSDQLLVKGVHIFTLNNLSVVMEILKRLGIVNVYIDRPLPRVQF